MLSSKGFEREFENLFSERSVYTMRGSTLERHMPKDTEELPSLFLSYILKVEGGYVNSPGDPGGATKYGVTQKSLDRARKTLRGLPESVRNLSSREASSIFYVFYYLPGGCDRLPWPLNLVHFDAAVHCGVIPGGKLLQRSLNRLFSSENPLKVDGLVGCLTLERALLFARYSPSWERLGVQELLLERMRFYGRLARKNPQTYRMFLGGWLQRLEILYDTVFAA